MSARQIVDPNAHTPRIDIHVQTLRLGQCDPSHDARIAVTSRKVLILVSETGKWVTHGETIAGFWAKPCAGRAA